MVVLLLPAQQLLLPLPDHPHQLGLGLEPGINLVKAWAVLACLQSFSNEVPLNQVKRTELCKLLVNLHKISNKNQRGALSSLR